MIKGIATYDNSASNPLNPNDPPQPMNWGELTTDEMFFCPIYYLPYEEGDENIYLGTNNETDLPESLIKDFVLYPSPASEYIDINFTTPQSGSLQIKIYDMLGREMLNQSEELLIKEGVFSKRLSIMKLDPGQYLLDIYFNGEKLEKSFVKM